MTIHLRKITAQDQKSLILWIKRYYQFDSILVDEEKIQNAVHIFLNDSRYGEAFFIELDNTNIGYLILTFGFDIEFGGQQATITDFFIDEGFRQKGYGKMAFQQLIKRYESSSVKALELQTTSGNTAAQAFYKSIGFMTHQRIPMSLRLSN